MNEHDQFDKEARMLWTSTADNNPQFLENAMQRLATAEDRFTRLIRRRDALESGVAAIMLAVLLPAAWSSATRHKWWFAAAFAWGSLYAAWVMFWLWRARRNAPADPGLPLNEYRQRIVARVDAQIALIRTARWWYVAPVLVFCALLDGAMLNAIPAPDWPVLWARLSFKFLLVLQPAIVIAVCWFIVKLNEGRGLESLRAERARLLNDESTHSSSA